MVKLMASGGVCGETPENTMPAFQAAVDQHYAYIELTARVTKDLYCVVLKNVTINRTATRWNGGIVGAALPVAELSFQQLLDFDFGVGYHVKFKDTIIPLLEEVLLLCRDACMKAKITADCWQLRQTHREALFSLLDSYADVAELTVNTQEALGEASARYPQMHLHWEGPADQQTIAEISKYISPDRITLWLREMDAEAVSAAKKFGSVGVSGLTRQAELTKAEALGLDIVATNGALKPVQNQGLLSDMHIHTDHSHDAHYPMEQMVQMGIEHGIGVIAVADHCDVTRCENSPDWDIYTNIKEACAEVDALNEKYADKCLLLRGVELGDGVWYPEQSNRVAEQLPYDVIVGATHAVRCRAAEAIPLKEKWFSQIKYLELPEDQFDELAHNYFDDMLTMTETQNIDIMAHLFCVCDYYIYRHGIFKDMRRYENQIVRILQAIIRKGIAMEMHGTLFLQKDGVYPYYWVVEKYYELGGYLITLSTDAHAPGAVGMGYENRIPMLKKTGFTHILYYRNRKAVPCSL